MSKRPGSARVYCRRMRLVILFLVLAALAAPVAAQKPAPAPPPAKKNPLLKLVEPWPTPEKMRERKAAAEALPLFASAEPLAVTLTGDFKTVNRDHDPNSKTVHHATLAVDGAAPID